jgi:hypothetical protein
LNTLLGAKAITYDFETAPAIINKSTSSYAGVIISGSTSLQYNDPGYYGAPSHELNPFYDGTFDFTAPVSAFGMDMRAYTEFASVISATIYAADDSTIIDSISEVTLDGNGAPIFFGYSGQSIGKVVFSSPSGQFANFDNLEFGAASAVPEPGTSALILAGLGMMIAAAYRRRVFNKG